MDVNNLFSVKVLSVAITPLPPITKRSIPYRWTYQLNSQGKVVLVTGGKSPLKHTPHAFPKTPQSPQSPHQN